MQATSRTGSTCSTRSDEDGRLDEGRAAWPAFSIAGMKLSGTILRSLSQAVVGANEPMPSVSKKLVTAPSAMASTLGRKCPCLRRVENVGECDAQDAERGEQESRRSWGPAFAHRAYSTSECRHLLQGTGHAHAFGRSRAIIVCIASCRPHRPWTRRFRRNLRAGARAPEDARSGSRPAGEGQVPAYAEVPGGRAEGRWIRG